MSSNASTNLNATNPQKLPTTGTWLLPLTAYFLLLSSRVVYHRLKNRKPAGDRLTNPSSPSSPSNEKEKEKEKEPSTPSSATTDPLYISIRAHSNFIENVPLAIILTAVAELNGGNKTWLNGAMAALLVSRIAHVELGLKRKDSVGFGRPVGYNGTLAVLGGMAVYAAWLCGGY